MIFTFLNTSSLSFLLLATATHTDRMLCYIQHTMKPLAIDTSKCPISGTSSIGFIDSSLSSSITPSTFHSIPGLKFSIPANSSDRNLFSPSRLNTQIPRTVYWYFWAYRFLLLVYICPTFLFLVSCGRLSWLMSVFQRTLK